MIFLFHASNSYATYVEGSVLFHHPVIYYAFHQKESWYIMQYIFQKLQIFMHGQNS